MQSPELRRDIVALGSTLGPSVIETLQQLFDNEQQALVRSTPAHASNIAYGDHERHTLDIYTPKDSDDKLLPVVLFVHGGGFLKGDKGSDQHWHNSNVGRLCAANGVIGVVINYRLAPEYTWPAGGEDVASAVSWLKHNISNYGGDADKLVLVGTSAGAVHLSTYLKLHPNTGDVRGLVLLSGLYGYTPLDERDTLYYGDQSDYEERKPRDVISATTLPLFVCCAEFDPPRFQAEFTGLLQERLERHQALPRANLLTGHNHYSMAMHLGTSDTRLADEILAFVHDVCL
ncbi:alpha/beta hydrolase [Aestuariicella hydrocarbonica]|uniref:Alpha/beta hydrolase n=1 Tax=Pseudomaricurvus hydrocarbonicus TaxID=1470433 RepID=A0A9E5JTY3_9GAMM|nr:alpha/beta hydrolase [Aestuariicella hydrocarbonica]NHO66783.1 alpha/beta hydrolase [Aestuariicella hydrocarbonica]